MNVSDQDVSETVMVEFFGEEMRYGVSAWVFFLFKFVVAIILRSWSGMNWDSPHILSVWYVRALGIISAFGLVGE